MENKELTMSNSVFERIKHTDQFGSEFWLARQLAKALEYVDYRNFLSVISKAKEACSNSEHNPEDHFVSIEYSEDGKDVYQSHGTDMCLSRYACYLIIQNADPSKEIVAKGQTYFAIQTRIAEIKQMPDYTALRNDDEKRFFLRNELRKHNAQLADAASSAGVVSNMDYAIFQNHGYMGLYGGLNAKEIARRKGIAPNKIILDFMGSSELAANLFRATQTEEKLRRENVKDKREANKIHQQVGAKVRQTIKDLGGTMPEDLPVSEDIKKTERRLASAERKLSISTKKHSK